MDDGGGRSKAAHSDSLLIAPRNREYSLTPDGKDGDGSAHRADDD